MNEKLYKETQNKGITLIALVITIIVLLILAGITIAMLMGENGIIKQAKEAKQETERTGAREKLQIEASGSYEEGKYDVNKAKENLKNNLNIKDEQITDSEGILTVEYENHKFYIDKKGKVTEGITSGIIASKPTEYFGKSITNYECENSEGVSEWQIFYADDEKIYLITSQNVGYEYAPKGKLGTSPNKGLSEVYKDYKGSEDILANQKTANLLKYAKDYPDAANGGIKASAYLLDTEAWKRFKGEKAEYAIGGPTIDLFIFSYNKKYPNNKIEYKIKNSGYYGINDDGCITGISTTDTLYSIYYTWIAGLAEGLPTTSDFRGWIPARNLNWEVAMFRPVVCLNSGIELNELENGMFEIK
ncbi:MAG: type II secretion system protein [Clostridia bacterium]|nr:type II secretion system protein [Clostridia bacterium]